MRNGGGAIMAIGRASGERRVERAIIDALDSPLLYGNDIGKAKRILFNIYASKDAPFFVPELSEISEFFDQLDPNIDVIWGTAEDDTLGEDAKVIILAADMDDDLQENNRRDEWREVADDTAYYESLIQKLYKPLKKSATTPAPKEDSPTANEQEEPTLTIVYPQPEENKENEADNPGFSGNSGNSGNSSISGFSGNSGISGNSGTPGNSQEPPKPQKPSMVERWKRWLERKVTEVVMDE